MGEWGACIRSEKRWRVQRGICTQRVGVLKVWNVQCAFAGIHSEIVQLACRCPEVAAASTQLLLPRPPDCLLGVGMARPPPSPGSTTLGRGRSAASTGAGPGHGRRRPGYSPGLGARATWIMRGVGFRPGGTGCSPDPRSRVRLDNEGVRVWAQGMAGLGWFGIILGLKIQDLGDPSPTVYV